MRFAEQLHALHERAAAAGPLGRLLFGVRLPLVYPLILLAALLAPWLIPAPEPAPPPPAPTPAAATEVDVMPRVANAPPLPEPIATPTPAGDPPAAPQSPSPKRSDGGGGNADWLLSLPPDGYTLQLLGSREEETLRAFVRRHGLESMTAYYRTRHKGGGWYVLLYGLYTDRDEASVAVGTLPPEVRKNVPFPRTIQSVQKAIRAGR